MYYCVNSCAVVGVNAMPVQVEVDVSEGLPQMSMVGSLGQEVREAKERVFAALKNIGLDVPAMHITVNLSPADLRKEGTAFDLPIAIGMFVSMSYIPNINLHEMMFLGEIGLNGEIKSVRGALPMVRLAKQQGIKYCFLPAENAKEGAVIEGIQVYGIHHLTELILFFQMEEKNREEVLKPEKVNVLELFQQGREAYKDDFSQVRGQTVAKRASLIAAAGFHNLLMLGPPGAGKSMIAKRIPGILPPLTLEESLEVTSVYSVAGLTKNQNLLVNRPFQSPHHTISTTALTGGGIRPRPGAISLAHRGVLFLDELPEFSKHALEAMRQPLENKTIQVARVGGVVEYPADFMLVCAMNPCPCGYFPNRNKCKCTEPQIKRYLSKISGPIMDRIDLCVELKEVEIEHLQRKEGNDTTSSMLQNKVEIARQIQTERFRNTEYRFNSDIQAKDMDEFCYLGKAERLCMQKMYQSLNLSARSYHRIIKVARTIADLEGAVNISEAHIAEALGYRESNI